MTHREIRLGDTILVSNVILGTVKTITNNTVLILEANSSTNVANIGFQHIATDQYAGPMIGNEYLKFPQVNILA